MLEYRTGIGYDRHVLVAGTVLILGGVSIPHSKSLAGHSDGDVLLHALVDAILGGSALGDIGAFFPDTDPKWKGVRSEVFLLEALRKVTDRHFEVCFVDAIVLAEKPKLFPHFPQIRENISRLLSLPVTRVSLKAKTEEGMDSIGQEKSMAAWVAATLKSR